MPSNIVRHPPLDGTRRRLGLMCLPLVLAACSAPATEVATPVTKASPIPTDPIQFDPCALPPDALQSAGLDASPTSVDSNNTTNATWHGCSWAAPTFMASVAWTSQMFDAAAAERNAESSPALVASRHAVSFLSTEVPQHETCDVLFAAGQGTVLIRADYVGGVWTEIDPCRTSASLASALNDHIPA